MFELTRDKNDIRELFEKLQLNKIEKITTEVGGGSGGGPSGGSNNGSGNNTGTDDTSDEHFGLDGGIEDGGEFE